MQNPNVNNLLKLAIDEYHPDESLDSKSNEIANELIDFAADRLSSEELKVELGRIGAEANMRIKYLRTMVVTLKDSPRSDDVLERVHIIAQLESSIAQIRIADAQEAILQEMKWQR